MAWTYAKRALKFAKLTNDGDEEGRFLLDRTPTDAEAKVMREYLGIPKAIELSNAEAARRRARGLVMVAEAPCRGRAFGLKLRTSAPLP
jgi:hypothetical protein